MVLYTIRLQPSLISKLHSEAKKGGVSHAVVARQAIEKFFAKAA